VLSPIGSRRSLAEARSPTRLRLKRTKSYSRKSAGRIARQPGLAGIHYDSERVPLGEPRSGECSPVAEPTLLIIDDPLKPHEAVSETQRKVVNNWFDHTLYSRLNDKRTGCIIIIMRRLHEDDLVGHVLGQEHWRLLRLPAIAEEDETHNIECLFQTRVVRRHLDEALHANREPLGVLANLRRTLGE